MTIGFPVVLRLAGRPVLVVGAGPVAARKIAALLDAGALITVIAPTVVDDIHSMDVTVLQRPYISGDCAGFRFVVVSTNVGAVQQQVYDECEALGIWCNAADDPERCSVTLPAVLRRGPVSVAVATDGSSPALAGVLRDRIADVVPASVAAVAEQLAQMRADMKARGESTESLNWKPTIHQMLDGQSEQSEQSVQSVQSVQSEQSGQSEPG